MDALSIGMTVLTFLGMKINEGVKNKYAIETHKVELMQQYCPTLTQLGPTPSAELLQARDKDCQPMRTYLMPITKMSEKRDDATDKHIDQHTSEQHAESNY